MIMGHVKVREALVLCVLLCSSVNGIAADGGLDAIKKEMGDGAVKITKKSTLCDATDKVPSLKGETWTFETGAMAPAINYNRYLNKPPHFNGTYPSLPNGDWGVGLEGTSFCNWYRGSCIRVLVNKRDIMSGQPANRIEFNEGANGYLRLIWDFEEQRSLALDFMVPGDGHAVFVCIALTLPGMSVESIEVGLTCYPGGFGPAYNLPSHRFAVSPQSTAEVSPDNPIPTITLQPSDNWVYYGDKVENKGSVGLIFMPTEEGGKVALSNYGVSTTLNYPVETRKIYLGFYAYDQENVPAQKVFKDSLAKDFDFMMKTPYWPETTPDAK